MSVPADDDRADRTARLLGRAQQAPRSGFAALHAHTAERLWLWANLHLLPPLRRQVPPEDFCQEVWARAYAAFPTYDHARPDFGAWLFGIAYNVLREQLRSLAVRSRRGRVDPSAAASELIDPRTSIATRLARNDQSDRLLAHAAALRASERQLLIWRGIEGLPFAEIGRRLGINAVAADSRWRRLCEQLRSAFPDWLAADAE